MANKMKLDFDGFEKMLTKLRCVDGNVTQATETALKESHAHVTAKLEKAIAPHRKTGDTEKSLDKNPTVEWYGYEASENVGFHISEGGLPSIFLMYGTTVFGQPHIDPDKELHDAIYGTKTKKEVHKIQREVMEKAIERAMKK